MNPPSYFERVRQNAIRRWEQLEADPELAAPWHHLFKQVQSPRHVLSELLQNADDARAKSATVRVGDNEFVFEHDGEDFTDEQFQSLCRFGYSNKRNLFTIGFRGVGFKSTFSLGDRVRIQTPTLDVVFDRDRFTLPVWSNNATPRARTRISVQFADNRQMKQLRLNLKEWMEEWITSPVSLLFFRCLLELTVESHTVRKEIVARGPIAGSQRIRLTGATTEELLLIRSKEEAFPEDVVNDIQKERNANDLHLPPCAVELILGLKGDQQLFVVLPAGTAVDLPYSINAPFLQDPARQKIKEPEVSPCNRWLLERTGRLAGEAMAAWLEKEHLTEEYRAGAYKLLRGPIGEAADLKTSASKLVLDATISSVKDEAIMLTIRGKLVPVGRVTALPAALHEVWHGKELNNVFAKPAQHFLSGSVEDTARLILAAHGWLEIVSAEAVIEALGEQSEIPRPSSWTKLQLLWNWVEENAGWDYKGERRRRLNIVPVQGQSVLTTANDVIRPSSRSTQISQSDWDFLSNFAPAIDHEWLDHLSKLKAKTGAGEKTPALELLKALDLHEPSQVDRIAAQASRRLLGRESIPEVDLVRIAHIFAALDASVPDDFRYATAAPEVQQIDESLIVFDADGTVEAVVPESWATQHILLPDYAQEFKSCTEERWFQWAYSAKSKLHAFVPLTEQVKEIYGRAELEKFLVSRGGTNPKEYRYKKNVFTIEDFDFPLEVVQYWSTQAAADPKLWSTVVQGLLLDPLAQWKDSLYVTVRQVSSQNTTDTLNCGLVLPAWLIHLRSVACLIDTHGNVRLPPELLLRTPDTESLMGIEPFVAAELDDTPDKKRLLRLLGVRDSATNWEKVVDRLRGLTKIKDAMRVLADLLRLYEALDRITMRCSVEDLNKLRAIFAVEALVLSGTLEWFSASDLSLHAEPEDNSPVVHSAAHSLALWLRVGVPERPALEKSLEWLKTLAVGTRLDGTSYNRAKLALTRGGRRVWDELGHWLSLDQTWEAVSTLKYRVSMRNLTRWENLSTPTKRAAADLRMLHGEVAEEAPFTVTQPLAEAITMQATQPISGRPHHMEWLKPLAEGLCRVKLQDEASTAKVREVARRLLNTDCQVVSRLEVTPYIDRTPVGEPLMRNVLWSDTTLFAVDLPAARLIRELKEQLTRPFGDVQVMEAVADCIDRDRKFVRDYLTENFELDDELPPIEDEPEGEEQKPESDGGDGKTSPETREDPTGGEEEADEDELSPEAEQGGDMPPEPDKPHKGKAMTFMDRYAKSHGFNWNEAERCYRHKNGAWIDRGEAPFSWQEHMNGNEVTKRLFVAEKSLASGVEIPYELWRQMETNPDSIALVLCAEDGKPNEWSANELKELKSSGQIHLHQSRFILKEISN